MREGDPALAALRHEPAMALLAGAEGLDAIRVLARHCRALLESGAVLLLEHGADQEEAVAGLLRDCGWSEIECFRDLAGRPRWHARTGAEIVSRVYAIAVKVERQVIDTVEIGFRGTFSLCSAASGNSG